MSEVLRELRIVICDDSPTFVRALRAFLEHDPALTVTATFRSAEALLTAAHGLDASLIVIGLDVPGIGCVAAIAELMREHPVPVLVVGGGAQRCARVAEALAAGARESIPRDHLRLDEPDDLWANALRSRIRRLASVRLSGRAR